MKVYYGKETELAIKNFPFSNGRFDKELIHAMAQIKAAAALANQSAEIIGRKTADAIYDSAIRISKGEFDDQFILPALQGGAGTSLNMNMNEVIAGLVKETGGLVVHPNDHVNCSQSTNDVNPSALRIACLRLSANLMSELKRLMHVLEDKAKLYADTKKLARTHLQDAIPTTMGAQFGAYAYNIRHGLSRIESALAPMHQLNLGGTAIGNSQNASSVYVKEAYKHLSRIAGIKLSISPNPMAQTQSQSDFCALSSALVAVLSDISKMASDLRLMASGPNGGFGEIILKPLQAGSAIMPGKVNPVLLESLNQLYCVVAGNDIAIREASQMAQLELGTMWPTVASKILESVRLSAEVISKATTDCISCLEVDENRCLELLEKSTAYATKLSPKLGYDVVASVVQKANLQKKTIREIVLGENLLDAQEFDKIVSNK